MHKYQSEQTASVVSQVSDQRDNVSTERVSSTAPCNCTCVCVCASFCRCQQWVELSGNEQIIEKFKNRGPSAVTKTFRVCSEHFKRNDYARFTDKKRWISCVLWYALWLTWPVVLLLSGCCLKDPYPLYNRIVRHTLVLQHVWTIWVCWPFCFNEFVGDETDSSVAIDIYILCF